MNRPLFGTSILREILKDFMSDIRIEESWKQKLVSEFQSDYMQKLRAFLKTEYQAGKKIFPRPSEYFAAFDFTPFDRVKVVILGQDPYHGVGQAHGLCFSVQAGVGLPPSLVNIYKELESDLGIPRPSQGNLQGWAEQGVLLLNSVLTVEMDRAASHQGQGWELFTDRVIQKIDAEKKNVVFILWGAYAQKKAGFVDPKKHLVIKSAHPSPLSSHRGFFGSKPFSKTNEYLARTGQTPIDWNL